MCYGSLVCTCTRWRDTVVIDVTQACTSTVFTVTKIHSPMSSSRGEQVSEDTSDESIMGTMQTPGMRGLSGDELQPVS